jgi:hypothetical protein
MSGITDLFGGGSNDTGTAPLGARSAPSAPSAADKLVEAEQQRTEAQRIDSIQRQLRLETASNSRGYGLRSLFGSLGPQRNSLLGSG